jgi:hypothetical protein
MVSVSWGTSPGLDWDRTCAAGSMSNRVPLAPLETPIYDALSPHCRRLGNTTSQNKSPLALPTITHSCAGLPSTPKNTSSSPPSPPSGLSLQPTATLEDSTSPFQALASPSTPPTTRSGSTATTVKLQLLLRTSSSVLWQRRMQLRLPCYPATPVLR